jgi:phage terminase large subunit
VREIVIEPPNPKQERFFNCEARFVAYGGARGGGKSWALRKKAALMACRYAGIRILLVRRTFGELYENHVLPLKKELRGLARYRESEKSFVFENGSRIALGYCDRAGDVLRYQGMEFDVIFIDEATQLTEHQFEALSASVRGANDFPKRVYLTCNPGGVWHEWVKRLFIDRVYREGENPEDYAFIPARLSDNKVLMEKDPGYVKMLERLPEDLRKAWRDGEWDLLAGRYFSEFDRSVHVVEPFDIPKEYRRYVTIDYGLDMLAAYWIAADFRGNFYVYRELYAKDLIISEAAEKIRALSKGEEIYAFLAPPDLWARQRESGKTAAALFAEFGVGLTRAGGARVDGWLAVKEFLKVRTAPTGEKTAKLRIFSCCVNLIRCLPTLMCDEKNPNDCAIEPHEITHAPDALRGFCSFWVSGARQAERKMKVNFEFERPKKEPLGAGERVKTI